MNTLVKSKYLKKIKYEIDGNTVNVYKLGKRGYNHAKDNGYIVYSSNSVTHDLEHSRFLINKYNRKDIINHYKSEKEMKILGDGSSRPDGFIINNGKYEFIETATSYLTKEQIKEKEKYAKLAKGIITINKV